jgi:hypothetical protein
MRVKKKINRKLLAIICVVVCIVIAFLIIIRVTNDELSIEEIINYEETYELSGDEGDARAYLGTYAGRNVYATFGCSDVCSANAAENTFVVYEGVKESDCEDIGGSIVEIIGWGAHYIGCSPLKN